MQPKLSRRTTLFGVAGILTGSVIAPQASATGLLAPRAEAWPEADALFKSDPRWRGADLALSTSLGPDRILWHFGDSFIDLDPPFERAGSTFVRNSIAIQHGDNPSSADIEFLWSTESGQPRAFFDADKSPIQRQTASVYWAQSSFVVNRGDQSVLAVLFGEWTHDALPTRLGTTWAFVENHYRHPETWNVNYVAGPDVAVKFGTPFEPRYWGITQTSAGHAEGYGTFHGIVSGNPVYRVRWSVADLFRGAVSDPEWKDGDIWRPLADFDASRPSEAAFTSRALQFGVTRDRLGYTMITQDGDYGPMAWDHAPKRDGMWGKHFIDIYNHPERQIEGVRVYHNWAHPELVGDGADLIATYATHGLNVSVDESTYYPRFVKIYYPGKQSRIR